MRFSATIHKICFLISVGVFFSGCSMKLIGNHPDSSNNTLFFDTEDGWRLAVNHYISKTPLKNRTPLVLCHGLGYNNLFWDLDAKVDFARYMSDYGYDVWVVSLRGAGASTKPGISILRNLTEVQLRELRNASFSPAKFNWNVDSHIKYDIPAILEFITQQAKVDKVTWIGHSLGGMIIYGYLGLYPSDKIQNVVTIASPILIPQPPNAILKAFLATKLLFKSLLLINIRTGSTAVAPFHRFLSTPDQALFYNKRNVDNHIIDKVLKFVVEDMPVGVVDQIMNMIANGDFLSYDGSVNYSERISNIDVPILLCCGKADNIAPPESVRYVYHNIASEDKTFALFGLADTYKIDYGHNDLILGKNAKREVYPLILKWLGKRTILK